MLESVALGLGWSVLVLLVLYVLHVMWSRRWLRGSVSWAEFRGEWAVVTGASGGTGAAFAEGLARRGMHLVLVARSTDALESNAKRIAETYHVQVRTITADLTIPAAYDRLRQVTADLPVTVLVNNVGGEPAMRPWLETTVDEETRTFATNVLPTLRLTRILLPAMVARHRGRILNLSSLCSLLDGTLLVSYSSDKCKINQISKALNSELHGTGVVVQSHVLGMVSTTGIGNIPPDGFHVVSPMWMAESSLGKFGSGGPVIVPVWSHALEAWIVGLLPRFIAAPITSFMSKVEQRHIIAARKKSSQ